MEKAPDSMLVNICYYNLQTNVMVSKRHIELFRQIHLIFLNMASFLHMLMRNGQTKRIPVCHIQREH